MNENLFGPIARSIAATPDRVAITTGGASMTYAQLDTLSARAAGLLRDAGVRPGDRVGVMLPNVPAFAVTYYGGLRAGATIVPMNTLLKSREIAFYLGDPDVRVLFAWEGARDEVEAGNAGLDTTVVYVGADFFETTLAQHAPVAEVVDRDLDDTAVILYTSGTTGKPKGIMHTSGGYLTQSSYTHYNVFDVKPESDVYWCTADIGWVTGHTYIVYGPLSNGVTQVVYEGTPASPNEHRHFEVIEKYGVTIYYTAPTLIRMFMKWGRQIPNAHDLSSLRLLGSVGEPINPEAWLWYRNAFGGNRTPIVDTWWQTETGSIMISPLPGVTATKPGSAMQPLPGITAKIVDEEGNELVPGADEGEHATGYLVLDQPWPSMLRGIWGDPERYKETYWSRYAEKGWYFAGDGARVDSDGNIWLLGRIDDVMNVSGHRISTTEVESALVGHSGVAEAAVVGASDETTGQGICAFVILKASAKDNDDMVDELREQVAKEIGKIARPREIHVVPELPKTRSGKIMRRLLRDVAEGRELGDTSTLVDPTVFEAIRASK
jgi:acetyl-CoA synthetase